MPFGDRALRFAIPEPTPRRTLLRELASLPHVVDVVLTETVGCVFFDRESTPEDAAFALEALARCRSAPPDEPGAEHRIEVVYDGEDLDAVASAIGRSTADVVALHAGAEYRVAMLGFLPGFAYLSGLPSELRLPRRAPRVRVPAGSVGIAADYTGIYPFASPGGWHLVGHAPSFVPFDPVGGRAALAMGDVVRFTPAPAAERRAAPAPPEPTPPTRPHLELTRAQGFALLVDGGRRGRMHEGIPPGGPLVRAALARANVLAGNDTNACAVELTGAFQVTARGGRVTIADDRGNVASLGDGESHVVATSGDARVRYLAVQGGIDAPIALGGRGALLVANIGGPLRRGSRLAPQAAMTSTAPAHALQREAAPWLSDEPIELLAGPDSEPPMLDALVAGSFRISAASDRTGTRLEGIVPPAGAEAMTRRSTPMTIGAIERTPSGLIVLGPDHPTTGGYPVVAVIRSASLDRLMAKPIGGSVRFRL